MIIVPHSIWQGSSLFCEINPQRTPFLYSGAITLLFQLNLQFKSKVFFIFLCRFKS